MATALLVGNALLQSSCGELGLWHSWDTAGTRDPFLHFCQCLLLSQWVKYPNGFDSYLGRKKAGFSKSRFLYYLDFMALANDSNIYF